MTYEEYKAIYKKGGVEFIKASEEHPEFVKRLREEREQKILDDFDLKVALRYIVDANEKNHGDITLLEQTRALFVSFCILNGVDTDMDLWDRILDRFVKYYEPEDEEEFRSYMGEYSELFYPEPPDFLTR